jgi:hypothetical protein
VKPFIAGVLAIWFVVICLLGATGAFVRPPGTLPIPVLIGAAAPLALFLAAYWIWPAFGAYVLSIDLPLASAIQACRAGGLGFLALYAHGVLPGAFAWPAGLGDLAIGVTAPWVALALVRRPGFASSKVFVAWNLLGILDLLVAVGIGGLHSVLASIGELTMGPMAQMPLVLIPAYLVPLFIMFHLTALFQVRRQPLSRVPEASRKDLVLDPAPHTDWAKPRGAAKAFLYIGIILLVALLTGSIVTLRKQNHAATTVRPTASSSPNDGILEDSSQNRHLDLLLRDRHRLQRELHLEGEIPADLKPAAFWRHGDGRMEAIPLTTKRDSKYVYFSYPGDALSHAYFTDFVAFPPRLVPVPSCRHDTELILVVANANQAPTSSDVRLALANFKYQQALPNLSDDRVLVIFTPEGWYERDSGGKMINHDRDSYGNVTKDARDDDGNVNGDRIRTPTGTNWLYDLQQMLKEKFKFVAGVAFRGRAPEKKKKYSTPWEKH